MKNPNRRMWPAKWPFVRTAHFGFTLGRLNYYRELGRFSWKRRYVMGGIMGRVKFRMKTNLEHLRYIWLYNCYIFWMSSVEFNNWYCYTKSKISETVTLSCRAVSELIVIRYKIQLYINIHVTEALDFSINLSFNRTKVTWVHVISDYVCGSKPTKSMSSFMSTFIRLIYKRNCLRAPLTGATSTVMSPVTNTTSSEMDMMKSNSRQALFSKKTTKLFKDLSVGYGILYGYRIQDTKSFRLKIELTMAIN